MKRRLNVTLAVKRLIRDLAARVPELSHVRASRILVVAGEARRNSRATIRPARRHGKPAKGAVIRVKGRTIHYVITLRPLWFLASTPEQRLATIVHELYHVSRRFDGTLHRGRRHSRLPRAPYARKVSGILRRYLASVSQEIVAPFGHHGVVRARMWLERPGPAREGGRKIYTEKQLFIGLARMR